MSSPPKRCDDGRLHVHIEDDQHPGWIIGTWSPKDPPSGARKRIVADRQFNRDKAVSGNDQLATPFASQDAEPDSVNRPSSQASRNATPDTPTPGDNLIEQRTPASSIGGTLRFSPGTEPLGPLGRTPAKGDDFQIFSSPTPLGRRTSQGNIVFSAATKEPRQAMRSITGDMNLSNHHGANASPSPASSILVPETDTSDKTGSGRRYNDLMYGSILSEAGSESDDNPYKKIADRARDRVVRLTETVKSGNILLRRLSRQHKFDVTELARAQASSVRHKQERDAAIAGADGMVAAVSAEKDLVVAKKDGRAKVLGWSLVLSMLGALAYTYWCWRNSAEFLYIREVSDKFYDTRSL